MKNLVGVGDVNTANKLAQWAYYALAGAVLALLADTAIRRVEGPGEGACAVAQMAGEDIRKTRPSPLRAVAETPAVQRAREHEIWLIECRKEIVTLEEVLGAGGADAQGWRELSACGSLYFL